MSGLLSPFADVGCSVVGIVCIIYFDFTKEHTYTHAHTVTNTHTHKHTHTHTHTHTDTPILILEGRHSKPHPTY